MPIMAKVLKTVAQFKSSPFLKDQDAALKQIAVENGLVASSTSSIAGSTPNSEEKENEAPKFAFIVTRPPALLRDGPSTRKLSASRSVRTKQ
jgi:hypothetical protein